MAQLLGEVVMILLFITNRTVTIVMQIWVAAIKMMPTTRLVSVLHGKSFQGSLLHITFLLSNGKYTK
jgi:hypothetical protein